VLLLVSVSCACGGSAIVRLGLKSGSLNLLEPSGPVKGCNGIACYSSMDGEFCVTRVGILSVGITHQAQISFIHYWQLIASLCGWSNDVPTVWNGALFAEFIAALHLVRSLTQQLCAFSKQFLFFHAFFPHHCPSYFHKEHSIPVALGFVKMHFNIQTSGTYQTRLGLVYSTAPVSTGNTFQDLPRLRETADNTERYI
jgi:hypothetical protein